MKKRFMLLVLLVVLLGATIVPAMALTARGRVVDTEEKPVSGIKVYALLAYYTPTFEQKVSLKAAVMADDGGEWVFESLPKPSGDYKYWIYYFTALEPGKMFGWALGGGELTSIPNAPAVPKEGFTIPAASLGKFEGQVTDKDGNPIAGAQVKMGVLLEIDEKCDPGG